MEIGVLSAEEILQLQFRNEGQPAVEIGHTEWDGCYPVGWVQGQAVIAVPSWHCYAGHLRAHSVRHSKIYVTSPSGCVSR